MNVCMLINVEKVSTLLRRGYWPDRICSDIFEKRQKNFDLQYANGNV